MGTKSKFFRAFVEGNTISDGRTITGDMIDQIVSTFNTDTYTPRLNIEHISGYSPEPPFNGYGSVVAVKAQTDDITIDGKVEKRKALYAQVEANDQLVTLAGKDQKPFPSVELTDSYAGSGKVGLIGMAFTDRPASIGTQALNFSRHAPGTVFASAADAVAIEFEAKPTDSNGIAAAIVSGFAAVAAKFTSEKPKEEQPKEKPKAANDNDFAAFATAMGEQLGTSIAAALKPVTDAQAKMQSDFAVLEGKLAKTEDTSFSRTPASGGGDEDVTDC